MKSIFVTILALAILGCNRKPVTIRVGLDFQVTLTDPSEKNFSAYQKFTTDFASIQHYLSSPQFNKEISEQIHIDSTDFSIDVDPISDGQPWVLTVHTISNDIAEKVIACIPSVLQSYITQQHLALTQPTIKKAQQGAAANP